MSYSKFAAITSDILVRKGEARPSPIMPPVPFLRMVPREQDSQSPEALARQFGFTALASALEDRRKPSPVVDECDVGAPKRIFDRTASQKSPTKAHKIMIALTSAEHETLGLIASKKGFTRHEVVRKALDCYFEWLAEKYGGSCRCVSGPCLDSCNN